MITRAANFAMQIAVLVSITYCIFDLTIASVVCVVVAVSLYLMFGDMD
jgi:hypothetical protein